MPALRWRPKYWYQRLTTPLFPLVGMDRPVTLADIEAAEGRAEGVDLVGSTFWASEEEFSAYLRAVRNGDSPD